MCQEIEWVEVLKYEIEWPGEQSADVYRVPDDSTEWNEGQVIVVVDQWNPAYLYDSVGNYLDHMVRCGFRSFTVKSEKAKISLDLWAQWEADAREHQGP